jgi:hypothetical protein
MGTLQFGMWLRAVLAVADVFHPVDDLAVKHFGDSEPILVIFTSLLRLGLIASYFGDITERLTNLSGANVAFTVGHADRGHQGDPNRPAL